MKARQVLEQLRQKALDLPFHQVGEIIEVSGVAADFDTLDQDDPLRWLLIQAGQHLERDGLHYRVTPKQVMAFSTWPGEGCEQANFGLAIYPKTIEVDGKRLRTNLADWSWGSFCKTQYASNPECGGIENYWEKRDIKALAQEVGDWNTLIAGWVGRFKDAFGEGVVSEIAKYPNFEHLEAKGNERQE